MWGEKRLHVKLDISSCHGLVCMVSTLALLMTCQAKQHCSDKTGIQIRLNSSKWTRSQFCYIDFSFGHFKGPYLFKHTIKIQFKCDALYFIELSLYISNVFNANLCLNSLSKAG